MAITPGGRPGDASPLGKPGSKRKLSDYEREVAHALIRKGHPRRDAIRMARGIIDKAAATGRWSRGRAKPNVRAGAAASVAQRHSFANGVETVPAIDLAMPAKKKRPPKSVVASAKKEVKKRGLTFPNKYTKGKK